MGGWVIIGITESFRVGLPGTKLLKLLLYWQRFYYVITHDSVTVYTHSVHFHLHFHDLHDQSIWVIKLTSTVAVSVSRAP